MAAAQLSAVVAQTFPPHREALVKRALILLPTAALLVAATCHNIAPAPSNLADLEWRGPKVYSTGSTGVPIAGYGINGTVDFLPGTPPFPVSVTKMLHNPSGTAVPAGYLITDTVRALRFVAVVGGSAGFDTVAGPPIAAMQQPGPALAPGDSADIPFTFVAPGCGMYKQVMHVDAGKTVAESDEADNRIEHFFAIPGSQTLDITVTPNPAGISIWHSQVPPKPNFTIFLPGLPYNAQTFTISAPAGTTFHYSYYTGFLYGVYGAVARLTGPPPVVPPAAPVAGPITINLQLQAVKAHDVPINDILLDIGREQLSGKVTAITADACFMRQRQASFSVFHP
jgi:hypothetical protein